MSESKSRLIPALQAAVLIAIAALFIGTAFIDFERSWGINHLKFITLPAIVILAVAAALIAGSIYNLGLLANSESGKPGYRIDGKRAVLIALLSGLLFYILQPHYPFLGDGAIRSGEIALGRIVAPTEPLATLTATTLFRTVGPLFDVGADKIFSLISAVSGLLLIVFLLFYFRDEDHNLRPWPFLFVLSLGTTAIFSGYVETYAMPALLAIVFSLSAFKGMDDFRWRITAIAAGSILLITHLIGVLFLPAVLYLLVKEMKQAGTPRRVAVAVGIFIACILPALYFAFFYDSGGPGIDLGRMFVTLDPGSSYWVFSSAHLLDIANELLLIMGSGFVIAIGALRSRRNAEPDRGRLILLILIAIPSAIFLVFFDPKLGMGRDWDLFAIPTVALAILVLIVRLSGRGALNLVERLSIILGLVVVLSFVLVNRFESSSTARFGYLLDLDHDRSPSGREVFADYRLSRGELEKAAEQYRRALEVEKNKRYYKLLSEILLSLDRSQDAVKEAFRAIRLDDTYSEGHFQLAQSLEAVGADSSAMHHYMRAVELTPQVARYRNALGALALKFEENEIAEQNFSEAVKLNSESAIYYNNLGTAKLALGKPLEAKSCFERALNLEGNFYLAMFNLGRVLRAIGQPDIAEGYFQKILNDAPESALAEQVRSLRDTLR